MDNITIILNNINQIYMRKNAITQEIGPILNKYKMAPGVYGGSNTCFHNASAQLFYKMDILVDFLIKNHESYKNNKYIYNFIILLKKMRAASDDIKNNSINDVTIMENVCPIIESYQKGRQDDASLLLIKILENILGIKDNFIENDPSTYFIVKEQSLLCDTEKIPSSQIFDRKPTEMTWKITDIDLAKDEILENLVKCMRDDEFEINETKIHTVLNINTFLPGKSLADKINHIGSDIKFMSKGKNDDIHKKPQMKGYINRNKYDTYKYLVVSIVTLLENGRWENHEIPLCDNNGTVEINSKKYELSAIVLKDLNASSGHYIAYIKYNNKWIYYSDTTRNQVDLKNKDISTYLYTEQKYIPYVILYTMI